MLAHSLQDHLLLHFLSSCHRWQALPSLSAIELWGILDSFSCLSKVICSQSPGTLTGGTATDSKNCCVSRLAELCWFKTHQRHSLIFPLPRYSQVDNTDLTLALCSCQVVIQQLCFKCLSVITPDVGCEPNCTTTFSWCSLRASILHWLLHHILFLRRRHTLTSKDFQLFGWFWMGFFWQGLSSQSVWIDRI